MKTRIALAAIAVAACQSPAAVSDDVVTPPSVAVEVAPQAAAVGQAFTFDASQAGRTFSDPGGRGLTYSVVFDGPARGLVASGARISGVPDGAGVVRATLTARDGQGRAASTGVAVAVFMPGLGQPSLPAQPFRYAGLALPAHFTAVTPAPPPPPGAPPPPAVSVTGADNTPADNPITDAGATLGRVLFYDRRMSVNDAISCASCHQQATGFSDPARLSAGFAGGATGRHSMSLVNARFYQRGRFFWDERAPTLEAQVLQPVQDPVEMGMNLGDLVVKLAATSYYAPLFTAAFGSAEVTPDRIARALAQFTRSMVSATSPFDAAFAGGTVVDPNRLSPMERQGLQLFNGPVAGCSRCHGTNAQVAGNVFNTGLDATITDAGAGNGRFKTPSLRNVGVRGRFMHDGRFTTLLEVIDHYDSGVQDNPGLDPGLREPGGPNAPPRRLNLTPMQKQALVAFLLSLTDTQFLTDPRLADPF